LRVNDRRAYRRWYRHVEKSPDPVLALSVLGFAEQWAEQMEMCIAAGIALEEIAAETHADATTRLKVLGLHTKWGDKMVDFLEQSWEDGKLLRSWYQTHA
jgi:hypothetical protein